MIPQIEWPDPQQMGDYRSAFQSGQNQRPLRLTLHNESLEDMSHESQEALSVIIELASLPHIELYETRESTFPGIRVHGDPDRGDYYHVDVYLNDELAQTNLGIHGSRLSSARLQLLTGIYDESTPEFQATALDLRLAEAHCALRRDLFITQSPRLLSRRSDLTYANILTLAEAAKLVGLFLRSRDIWVYRLVGNASYSTSRSTFYWFLARHSLPALWRYVSSCGALSRQDGSDAGQIGLSSIVKCSRALLARDEIAIAAYSEQDHSTLDAIMYHFDYLTLLLSGAFDSLATITNRIYRLVGNDRQAKFRYDEFLRELQRSRAQGINDIVCSDQFRALLELLFLLRNTIHSASLEMFTHQDYETPARSFASIPDDLADRIVHSAQRFSSLDEWGIREDHFNQYDPQTAQLTPSTSVILDPMTYSAALLTHCLEFINSIAASTDFGGVLEAQVLTRGDFAPEIERADIDRIAILG